MFVIVFSVVHTPHATARRVRTVSVLSSHPTQGPVQQREYFWQIGGRMSVVRMLVQITLYKMYRVPLNEYFFHCKKQRNTPRTAQYLRPSHTSTRDASWRADPWAQSNRAAPMTFYLWMDAPVLRVYTWMTKASVSPLRNVPVIIMVSPLNRENPLISKMSTGTSAVPISMFLTWVVLLFF